MQIAVCAVFCISGAVCSQAGRVSLSLPHGINVPLYRATSNR